MVVNALTSFKVRLQEVTVQSTIETELVVAALTMKESMFYSNDVGAEL